MEISTTLRTYIQSFIIGSSWPVFIWYFKPASEFDTLLNFDYKKHAMIAPIFLGLLNVFGMFIAQQFGLSKPQRFFLTGLIGSIALGIFIKYYKTYNYPNNKIVTKHYISLFIIYIYIYCIVVYMLEDLLVGV